MKKFLLFSFVFIGLLGCQEEKISDLSVNSIIPDPQVVEASGGYYVLKDNAFLVYDFEDTSMLRIATILSGILSDSTRNLYSAKNFNGKIRRNGIHLMIDAGISDNDEGYELELAEKYVIIKGATDAGAFRGMQTFLQLMELGGSDVVMMKKGLAIPTGVIRDFPEYSYRGVMLDVARHFSGPEVVKAYIDLLTLYKINVLHMHLSDDQGWRIEIKSWPLLTEHGGQTAVGGGEGGFYTQEEYAALVAYAAERYITIIPEIDMPGHTNAALASYAELNCDGKVRELYTGTHVGFSSLCVRDELCYKFIDDVIGELVALTPGKYIHIGGDESHATDHDDYVYFINRVKKIVDGYGKQMMGWDELAHGEIGAGDVAQFWHSKENALKAVSKGAKLVMSPATYCYLDMKYDSTTVLGITWAGLTEVDEAYSWKPLDLIDGLKKEQILGVEAPLWGETTETLDDIEYLTFPRIIGHAEIGWSNSDSLNWEEYRERLAYHGAFLEARDVNFYASELVDWK